MKIIITHQNHKVSELNIDRPVENVQVVSEEEKSVAFAPQALIILLRLLLKDTFFQSQFLQNQPYNNLRIILDEPFKNEIDYKSCNMAFFKVWDQVELEDALHWLSTLGGAYSNLGDHSMDFAIKAGKNAIKQMTIALRSPDPLVIYKCWLFVAMSLMQQKQLKKSKAIIQRVHQQVKSDHDDKNLLCMCKGIWARLRYTWKYTRI